jgi:hypothetical protein
VAHNGATWQAHRDTGKEPGTCADWTPLARSGRDGSDGATPCVRGTWSADAAYAALDIVAFNGGSFIAKQNNPGACPGEGWQLIAGVGKRGVAGERGASGARGERGEKGEAAPRLVSWRVDRKKFAAIGKMSDGSETVLSLQELFEEFHSETR